MGFQNDSSSSDLTAGSLDSAVVFTGYSISLSFILASVAEMIDAAVSGSSVLGFTVIAPTFGLTVF